METVDAFEARTNLSKLLDRDHAGEEIAITRHGTPIAMLVPCSGKRQLTVPEVIARMIAFRRKKTTDGMTIRQMINEDRRRRTRLSLIARLPRCCASRTEMTSMRIHIVYSGFAQIFSAVPSDRAIFRIHKTYPSDPTHPSNSSSPRKNTAGRSAGVFSRRTPAPRPNSLMRFATYSPAGGCPAPRVLLRSIDCNARY